MLPVAPPAISAPAALTLPPAFVSAVETLAAQGLPGPRGGEYRVVSVQGDVTSSTDQGLVETHGWVLPAAGPGPRAVLCWNGLVYRVETLKGKASLEADVARLIRRRKEPLPREALRVGEFIPSLKERLQPDHPSLMKAALLYRLGQTALAAKVLEQWKGTGDPVPEPRGDLALGALRTGPARPGSRRRPAGRGRLRAAQRTGDPDRRRGGAPRLHHLAER